MTRYLLDTSVAIEFLGGDAGVKTKFEEAEEVSAPAIALGELYAGALKAERTAENLAAVYKFASDVTVLVCDLSTARYYATIKHQLRRKGRPIPDNDVWIAAVAMQHNLVLVTRDAHFGEIDNLQLERW